MNVQIFSDLHISINKKIPNITPTAQYLILAGDIGKIGDSNYLKFIEYVNNKWDKVIYVLGNHELYNKKSIYGNILEYQDWGLTFQDYIKFENIYKKKDLIKTWCGR